MRFWPAVIMGAIIGAVLTMLMPRMFPMTVQTTGGENLRRRARSWIEESGQRVGEMAAERLGRS